MPPAPKRKPKKASPPKPKEGKEKIYPKRSKKSEKKPKKIYPTHSKKSVKKPKKIYRNPFDPGATEPSSYDYMESAFDPGDTGPMSRPQWVKKRMYELGDIELSADSAPYDRASTLMKIAAEKVGPEELLGLVNFEGLGGLRGLYAEEGLQATNEKKLLKRIREEGVEQHQFPHYRERLPKIMFPATLPQLSSDEWDTLTAYSDEGAPTSRRAEREDLLTKYDLPENLKKRSLAILGHEKLHYYNEANRKRYGENPDIHRLIYYLQGLAKKDLKDTPYDYTPHPMTTWRRQKAMGVPFESEIKGEEMVVESGGIPDLARLLDDYLQKETDKLFGKLGKQD